MDIAPVVLSLSSSSFYLFDIYYMRRHPSVFPLFIPGIVPDGIITEKKGERKKEITTRLSFSF